MPQSNLPVVMYRLLVESNVVTCTTEGSAAWATHFEQLGSPRVSLIPQCFKDCNQKLHPTSPVRSIMKNILLTPRLKVPPEHVINSGPIFKRIF